MEDQFLEVEIPGEKTCALININNVAYVTLTFRPDQTHKTADRVTLHMNDGKEFWINRLEHVQFFNRIGKNGEMNWSFEI